MFGWKLFKKKQPKKDGWYICTVEVPGQQRYVMDLYWYSGSKRFKDNRRQTVYDYYNVTDCDGNRIHTEKLCDRTENVIAWRKEPKTYMKGFVRRNGINEML